MTGPRAAVDVGSNSVRLLVTDGDGVRLRREMAITRLGQDVDRTGRLDERALARTLDAIAGYRAMWTAAGVDGRVRIAATSAVRDATNRDTFLAGVRRVAGLDAEVLTGEQEAALAFAGAAGAVDAATPTAVVDVGGGSTEIIVGDAAGQVAASVSVQLGCVRLTERALHDDPPTSEQVAAAQALIDERLDAADTVLGTSPLTGAAALVAVAGTATTLGALHLGLDAYREERIHACRVPTEAVLAWSRRLVRLSSADRGRYGPVQRGREDVLHGGVLVLATALERSGLPELIVSEADGLDGLAASLS